MVFPFLAKFTKKGIVPDTSKMAIPVGHKRPETIAEQVARLVKHSEFARQVNAAGLETFEEADNFDIPDDLPSLLPNTPWEADHDLAIVHAHSGGVVDLPAADRIKAANDALEKAKTGVSKRKEVTPAATPAKKSKNVPVEDLRNVDTHIEEE